MRATSKELGSDRQGIKGGWDIHLICKSGRDRRVIMALADSVRSTPAPDDDAKSPLCFLSFRLLYNFLSHYDFHEVLLFCGHSRDPLSSLRTP
jgi:hypothetical protein